MNLKQKEVYDAWLELAKWENLYHSHHHEWFESVKYKMQQKCMNMSDEDADRRLITLNGSISSYMLKKMSRNL